MEDGRVPGSTLVSSVKGKEGKDSGSNPPSAGGGWQSLGSTLVSSVKGKEGKDSGSNPPIAGGGWQCTGFDSC